MGAAENRTKMADAPEKSEKTSGFSSENIDFHHMEWSWAQVNKLHFIPDILRRDGTIFKPICDVFVVIWGHFQYQVLPSTLTAEYQDRSSTLPAEYRYWFPSTSTCPCSYLYEYEYKYKYLSYEYEYEYKYF